MDKKIFLILILIFSLYSVSGLGVTPARKTVDYVPGLEGSVGFSVLNSESKDIDLVVYSEGELSENVFLSESSFSMSADEKDKQLGYDYKLPSGLSPGVHTADIVVLQVPKKSSGGDNYVGATLAVVTELYVQVPYPGKYAEAELNIINPGKGEEARFIIPVASRGKVGLADVYATIDIYNKLNGKVGSVASGSVSLEQGERKELVANWNASVEPGEYRAVVNVVYGREDGQTISLEKVFNVGSKELDLQSVEVNNFQLGGIAKLEMLVENKWGEPIKEAYVETNVYDSSGAVMANFKSANYDFDAFEKKSILAYWDTQGVKEGTYGTEVFLKHSSKSTQKAFELKVSQNDIQAVGLGYVISSGESEGGSLVTILIIALVVLVLVNVLWFLVFRKFLKK